jgi:hypothetical protein
MPAINQKVITPNGPGVYQGRMYSDGEVTAMVSHAPKAEIDKDKARWAYGDGHGIWFLCGYPESEVTDATATA